MIMAKFISSLISTLRRFQKWEKVARKDPGDSGGSQDAEKRFSTETEPNGECLVLYFSGLILYILQMRTGGLKIAQEAPVSEQRRTRSQVSQTTGRGQVSQKTGRS